MKGEIRTVMYDTRKHVIFQVKTDLVWEKYNKHEDTYFEAKKAFQAQWKTMLCSGRFFGLITLFGKTRSMDAVADQPKVYIVRTTFMSNWATNDAAGAA